MLIATIQNTCIISTLLTSFAAKRDKILAKRLVSFCVRNMKEIKLTQGKVALVDDEDFEYLNGFKWCINACGYATRYIGFVNGVQKYQLMHRLILSEPQGFVTDHINGVRSDNRKSNLRICRQSENARNKAISIRNTSGYKGVCLNRHKKWEVYVTINYKRKYVGSYSTRKEAAIAYNNKAIEVHGEFAKLNTI